jgi:hypothetical protein
VAGSAIVLALRWPGNRHGADRAAWLSIAAPSLDPILRPRGGDGLPLYVQNRVVSAAGERHNVILPIAWTRTAPEPRGRAGMLLLEFPGYLAGSVLSRRERAYNKR